jgi:hypothetical protein
MALDHLPDHLLSATATVLGRKADIRNASFGGDDDGGREELGEDTALLRGVGVEGSLASKLGDAKHGFIALLEIFESDLDGELVGRFSVGVADDRGRSVGGVVAYEHLLGKRELVGGLCLSDVVTLNVLGIIEEHLLRKGERKVSSINRIHRRIWTYVGTLEEVSEEEETNDTEDD